MTWQSTTQEQIDVAKGVVLWIETARAAGYGGPNWLPTGADFYKSALFERIRSGKQPLAEPPPRGLSCPWYALIEDPGPHYVFDVWQAGGADPIAPNCFVVLQHPYKIVEERSEHEFVVKDGLRDTSYRFLLWFDPDWKGPNGMVKREPGGWFIELIP